MMRPHIPILRFLLMGSLLTVAGLAQQDTVFTPKRMKDWNERATEGRCILRVRVDDEIDVELHGDRVLLRVLSGRSGRDEGSECNQPLPSGGFTRFTFKGIDGRGEVRMVQEPRPGNGWTGVVAIRDKKGGDEGYTFELSWTSDGRGYSGGAGAFATASSSTSSSASSSASGSILPNLGRPAAGQSNFNGIDETVRGSGSFSAGSENFDVRRVRVTLRPNGEAEITIYANEVFTLTGRWSGSGDALNLEMNAGFGSAGASARGKVYLTRDGRFDSVELDGSSSRFRDAFRLRYGR